MQRDIFNRIKHERGCRLKAPELTWLTDKVEAAFVKHEKLLFLAEPVPYLKPTEKKKKKKKKIINLDDQEELYGPDIEIKLPLRGKEKLKSLDSSLLTD
jgi:hypothetical protein